MLLQNEIFRHLSTHAGLAALIQTAPDSARIYPVGQVAQGCLRPYISYQRIYERLGYTHSGVTETAEDRVQFDCWADTLDAAYAVAAQLCDALDNWSSPAINRAFIVDKSDGYDEESKLSRVMVDTTIWNGLTAP